jgi:hypothetical protein
MKQKPPDNKIWKLTIPNYEDKVPISQKRRAKYFKQNESKPRLPKKHLSKIQSGHFKYDKLGYLVDENKNRVLANPIVAGTPRYWTINGQRIYDGSLHYTARSKVARWMHGYLGAYISKLPALHIPEGCYLRVWIDMYKPADNQNWDCDNQWPWTKWFLDTLVEHKKIPEDNVQYIRSSGQITYIPSDERKLVFNIQII